MYDELANLEVVNVSKVFIGHKNPQVEALRGVTFSIDKPEFVSVIGPNGCGKTTLLRIIAGLLKPTSGEIKLGGLVVNKPSRDVAMVFQEAGRVLFPWLDVEDNIRFGLEIRGVSRQDQISITGKYLDFFGLRGFEKSFPYELSSGMKQKVQLARVMALNPEVLLMDEPYSSLDAQTCYVLQKELLRLYESEKISIIFVTHDLRDAIALADRIILISARPGSVVCEVRVPFGRPRDPADAISQSAFSEVFRNLWGKLAPEIDKCAQGLL